MKEINEKYPLILVFYFDKELYNLPEILAHVIQSVEKKLENTNTKAFFLKCADGENERVECINPIQVETTKMDEINKMIEDIKKQFDIGQGADDNLDDKCNCNNDEGCIYCNK